MFMTHSAFSKAKYSHKVRICLKWDFMFSWFFLCNLKSGFVSINTQCVKINQCEMHRSVSVILIESDDQKRYCLSLGANRAFSPVDDVCRPFQTRSTGHHQHIIWDFVTRELFDFVMCKQNGEKHTSRAILICY